MKDPIRCFEGSAKPHEPFWNLRNAAETGGTPEMEMYGFISEYSWLEDDITPALFKNDLYKLGGGGPLTLRINSPGGDVLAASVIRSIMTDYPGDITVRIDGVAASAAVIVAMAGKTVKIMDSAYMMIHDPYIVVAMASLDIEILSKLRDQLKSIKDGIVSAYAGKTGLSVDRVAKMMADETWMSAPEAVKFGFADEVITGGQGSQQNAQVAFVNALKNFANVPLSLLPSVEPEPDIETREAALRLRAKVKLLK